jgi:hypothetical protein
LPPPQCSRPWPSCRERLAACQYWLESGELLLAGESETMTAVNAAVAAQRVHRPAGPDPEPRLHPAVLACCSTHCAPIAIAMGAARGDAPAGGGWRGPARATNSSLTVDDKESAPRGNLISRHVGRASEPPTMRRLCLRACCWELRQPGNDGRTVRAPAGRPRARSSRDAVSAPVGRAHNAPRDLLQRLGHSSCGTVCRSPPEALMGVTTRHARRTGQASAQASPETGRGTGGIG